LLCSLAAVAEWVKRKGLRKNPQFASVYERGRTWANDLVVLGTVPNGVDTHGQSPWHLSKQALLDALWANTHSPTGIARGTLPFGLLEWNRYGFVAGKRLAKTVVRNLVKKLLPEAARTTSTKTGWDVVLIARSQAAAANYHKLGASVAGSLRRPRI
jgi:RNase P protein component